MSFSCGCPRGTPSRFITCSVRASSADSRRVCIAIVVAGSFAVFSHRMTVGELVAFNMLSTRVISPVLQFIGLLNNYQETLMSVEMLGEVMDRKPEQAVTRGLTPGIAGNLSFDDLTFSYPGSGRPAISRRIFPPVR